MFPQDQQDGHAEDPRTDDADPAHRCELTAEELDRVHRIGRRLDERTPTAVTPSGSTWQLALGTATSSTKAPLRWIPRAGSP
ncbi:hypothetical protein KZZ52_14845 [Dactylosporangium sp. AC04546]|uniref:hypothetical protein n=1 Tax=Dactylosporangium sp. AC04546 TaxID=2862460 RepID=UPI001EE1170D|nr:hypothetical protein [Dactylosporangium sp. AC04546]WVK86590.1 hypothetical protein KZZ52_14845 [Dactylosporangium sp. AC04546]